jgi:hypothetical protein
LPDHPYLPFLESVLTSKRLKHSLGSILVMGELAYAGRMKEGAFLQTDCLIKWFEEKGMPVHPTMKKCHQELGMELP